VTQTRDPSFDLAAAADAARRAGQVAERDPLTAVRLLLAAYALDPNQHQLALSETLVRPGSSSLRVEDLRPAVAGDAVLPNTPITAAMRSADGKTLTWSVTNAGEFAPGRTFTGHTAPVILVAKSGSRAVTVGAQGHVTVWDLDNLFGVLANPAPRACELLGGEFTPTTMAGTR
jgi:hypothetical protein